VLDAVSSDGRIVVEASIEKGYFSGSMLKPKRDLAHSLTLAPAAEEIFLLCSQRAETGVIERMVSELSIQNGLVGKRLNLMDSRSIAEALVDQLMLSDDAIDELAEYLPVLSEIRDDHPASLNAPPLSHSYISNELVDAELDKLMGHEACIEISGIGGIGKSQAAAACLERCASKFDYRFWVSGRDVDSIERLSSVPVRRGGAERNISALLRRNSTLLVIDDAAPGLDVSHLSDLCGPDSRIIITRQNPSGKAYSMPPMHKEQARSLLNQGVSCSVPHFEFERIWAAVGGHPLSLALLNAAAREGVAWSELAEDCSNVAKLPVSGGRLADRILGRLRPVLEDELSLFQWAGQSHCDRAFFKHVVGSLRLRAFERHGITAPESDASIRIHDIAFASLRSLNWLTEARSNEIDGHLEEFITRQIRNDGHGLQLIASQLRSKIALNVERGDRRSAFLYALSTIWSGASVPVHLFPDPLQEARRIASHGAIGQDVAILVVLESIEAKERHLRHTSGTEAARTWLGGVEPAYEILAGTLGLADRQVAEIKHHHAKTLRALGRRASAMRLFEEVVTQYSLNDSKLQLIRLIGADPNEHMRAKRYASEIISEKVSGHGVSPSLLMAMGDCLNGARLTWGGALIAEHEELFLSEALYSAAMGIPQGYHSLANFARAVVWHAPERVFDLLARLPEPTPLMLDDDQSRGSYAEIMLIAGKAGKDGCLGLALDAYESLKHPDAYQRRKWGEVLYQLKRYLEAEQILEEIDGDPSGRIWLAHSLSQVKMELGKLEEALALVDESVDGAVGVNEKYLSSFLLQRVKLKKRLKIDASSDIARGRASTNNVKLLEEFSTFDSGESRLH